MGEGCRQGEWSISIHALLAESDNAFCDGFANLIAFQSTLSLRRATTLQNGARAYGGISIHALLAESDRTHGLAMVR